jgi:hypothetical protein
MPALRFAGRLAVFQYILRRRLQRQIALYDHKVDVPDAMRFFEGYPPSPAQGVLPLEMIYSAGELDALPLLTPPG